MSGDISDDFEEATKKPDPMTIHVGSRVRLRRRVLGMSQKKLGKKMGLSFQQIQKYEKGTNRIAASRLFELSQILDVPVQFFFEDGPIPLQKQTLGSTSPIDFEIMGYIETKDGYEFNKAAARIRDPEHINAIKKLLRSLDPEPKL